MINFLFKLRNFQSYKSFIAKDKENYFKINSNILNQPKKLEEIRISLYN